MHVTILLLSFAYAIFTAPLLYPTYLSNNTSIMVIRIDKAKIIMVIKVNKVNFIMVIKVKKVKVIMVIKVNKVKVIMVIVIAAGGHPRSGTTLMRAMLDAHSAVRCYFNH